MLRLLTLGSLAVHGPEGPLGGSAAQPRRLAVLVLIARGGERGTARGKVVAMLWPDVRDEQGRKAISQALFALRRDLGRDDAILGTQVLRLNEGAATVDLVEFERALGSGAPERAVTLYGGPFLEGFRLPGAPEFERWADDERRLIERRFHEALESLATASGSRGALDEAVRWWRRRSACDPLDGRVALATMKAIAAAGDLAGALRHAGLFEALVAEELAMPADRDVVALADALRREVATHARAAPVGATRPTTVAVLPFSVLGAPMEPRVEREWRDGLAEEIIHSLLAVPAVRVVSRSASFALGPSPSLAALRELDVSHAVEGCVRSGASGIRVTVRLIEAAEGRAVWWDRLDLPYDDAHAAHEHVAARVARQVM